jgi:hypothetical protein
MRHIHFSSVKLMWDVTILCKYVEYSANLSWQSISLLLTAVVLPSRNVLSYTKRTEQPSVMIFQSYMEIILRIVLIPCLSVCHTEVQLHAFMCASLTYQLTKLTNSLVYVVTSQ